MQVSGDTLAFFLLKPDAGIEEQFLLVLLHPLQFQLVTDDLTLVKNDENNQPDSERQHTDSAKK